jgi:ATP-dependent Clp protease ATP-binding subunit ClpB
VEATIAILRGLKERYQVHHGVDITDPAIVAAAELSHRYITDRFLPDKAIDLIDEAAAKIKIETRLQARGDGQARPSADPAADRARGGQEGEGRGFAKRFELINEEIAKLQKEIADLDEIWKAEKATAQGSAQVRKRSTSCASRSTDLTRKGDLAKVAELQYGKLPELEKRLKEAQDKEAGKAKAKEGLGRSCCAPRSAPKRSPRWWRAPPASRSPN